MVARKVWGYVVITNRTRLFDNNRFPTTTFGNDDKKKSKSKNQCHPRGFWRPAGFFEDLPFRKRTTTAKTDSRLQLSGMTTSKNKNKNKNQCHPRGFLSGICRSVRKQQRQTTDSRLQLSGMTKRKEVVY